ncbi:MAG: dienelactone hydrolase [Arenicella sp.]|jgi:dienelactone hydrolase
MKNLTLKKFSACAFSLLFSLSAYSGGGGGGGSTDLPPPSTCSVSCGFEIGPNPNLNFVRASQGPLPVSTSNVSSSVDGFGGGTIYYPSNISDEMAAIAISPGFTASQSSIAWWGPLLASHGFVVITIDTNGRFDQPTSRGRQLDSALSYLISEGDRSNSPVSGRIDENRLATMGHSMGGGGALQSAARNRLSASVPLAPFNTGSNDFNQINVPTMIMGCEDDGVAPVNSHANPFYALIPNSTDKALLEIANGPHNCANGGSSNNATLSTYGVSWMKRFLDKDRRYNQFLCGPNHVADSRISDFRETCTF